MKNVFFFFLLLKFFVCSHFTWQDSMEEFQKDLFLNQPFTECILDFLDAAFLSMFFENFQNLKF